MKNLILFTFLSVFAFSCKKKEDKKPRDISFTYQLAAQHHFEVTVEKNGTLMFGYSDQKYTAYPQGDGTYKTGSTSFQASKGDKISVNMVDNYLSGEPISFKLFVNGEQVSITDVNSVESAIVVTYIVE